MNNKCWWGCRKSRTFIHCCGSVIKSCPTLTTPWTVACQAPLPMGFPGQEYWNGLPFPSPGDLPNLGMELESLAIYSPALLSHQQSPTYIVGRTANGVATLENSLALPQKVNYGVTIWISNLTPRCLPKITEYRCLNENLYVNIHSSTIHSSQKVETTPMSNNWWMNKWNVYSYNGRVGRSVVSGWEWIGMGEFNSDDHYIYCCGQESLRRNGIALIVNKRVWNAVLGRNLKNDRMISVCFQSKPFSITVIQVYAPTTNAEEADVEQFYEDS